MTNQTSRRAFLGVAGALAAGSVANITAVVARQSTPAPEPLALPAASPEDTELLELGRQVEPLLEAFRTAHQRMVEARAVCERLAPAVPEELIYEKSKDRFWLSGDTSPEISPLGERVHREHLPDRQIYCSKQLRSTMIIHDISRNTARGRHMRKLIRAAQRFERGRAEALRVSGYDDLECEARHCAYEIDRLVRKIQDASPPKSLAGVMVIARALSAYSADVNDMTGMIKGAAGILLGPKLADAVQSIGVNGAVAS